MSTKDPYYNTIHENLTNMAVKRLLSLANIKSGKNFTQNCKKLSEYLLEKFPRLRVPKLYLKKERSIIPYISKDLDKITVIRPSQILTDNNIPFERDKTRATLDKVLDKVPDKVKVKDMINKAQNYELIQATTEKLKYKPIVNEKIEYVDNKGKTIGYLGKDEIIIKEPEDIGSYLQTKVNAIRTISEYAYEKSNGKAKPCDIDGEPYFNYYSNYVGSLEDIKDFLDLVYKIEKKPFKLHFSFGSIYEEPGVQKIDIQVDGKTEYVEQRGFFYSFVNANPYLVKRSIPAVVNGPETLDLYKEYIENTIEQAKDMTYISTKHRWISIVNIMFSVYRMMPAKGKLDFLPPELLKNRSLLHYNEDNNLCFWAAYAAYIVTMTNTKDKKGLC